MLWDDEKIPEGYLIFPHQVAGHRFEEGKKGMLIDKSGRVLKPVQEPPRGKREVDFYHRVFAKDISDPITLQLRSFLPTFYGIKFVSHANSSFRNNYIELEDVTRHFNKPCILDIKIGQFIFDHLATEAKKERAKFKYPEQELFGFRILGMKVYKKEVKQFKFYDKSFGKRLKTHQEVLDGLREFFSPEIHGTEHVLKILERCKTIKNWFLEQREFRFFSSSVLIVYEGETLNGCHRLQKVPELSTAPLVEGENYTKHLGNINFIHNTEEYNSLDNLQIAKENEHVFKLSQPTVHLIDFAHTYTVNLSEPDRNYLHGLQCLIQCFEEIINGHLV